MMKKFGYWSILFSFLFELVPTLQPIVMTCITHMTSSHMARWVDLIGKLGGWKVTRATFDDDLFHWYDQQIIAITHMQVSTFKGTMS